MNSIKTFVTINILICFMTVAPYVMACHKGGAIGYASKDPINSTIDYSSASTFITASTSGTLGCKN